MKKILIGLVVVVLIITGGLYYVYTNAGSFIKTAVETAGTEVTKVSVTLDNVDLDLPSGKASMNGLNVANPGDFKTDYAINLGAIAVDIDESTITDAVVVVNEVVVTSPKVIYELNGTNSNIATIQKNVENFVNAMGGSGGSSGGSEPSSGGETKVVIENLYIRGGEVAVSAGFLEGKKMGVDLPEIHLTDIGKESNGASGAEVAAKVLDSLTEAVVGSVASLNLGDLMKNAEGVLEGATDAVKGVTEGAGDIGGEAGKAVDDAVGGATDAVKGLFNSN